VERRQRPSRVSGQFLAGGVGHVCNSPAEIHRFFQSQDRAVPWKRWGIPDDVQNHLGVGRVALVAVGAPVGRKPGQSPHRQTGRFHAELQDSVAEIGAGFMVPKAGVKDAQGLALKSLQLVPLQALMEPELWRRLSADGRFRARPG